MVYESNRQAIWWYMTQFYNRNTTRHGHCIKSHHAWPAKTAVATSCSSSELSPPAPAGWGWGTSPLVALAGRPAFCRRDSRIDMSLMLHFGSRSSFRSSLAISIWVSAKQDLWKLKNARELIGRDLLQGITGLCHIDRGAPTSPCILRGLAMYRGYIAHRVSLAHIAHIGAHIDILPSILCVYQYSTYLLYIANLVCISHHIRKSGIILPSYRFYIYITWYVVTCPHITG